MYRILLLALISILFIDSFCLAQASLQYESAYNHTKLNGKVKRVVIKEYGVVYKSGKTQPGQLISQTEYQFDSNGNELAHKVTRDQSVTVHMSKYDSRKRLIEWDEYIDPTTLYSKRKYIYNENNKLIEIGTFTPKDVLIGKNITTYDKFGNKSEQSLYDASGNISGKTQFVYIEKQLSQELYFNSNNTKIKEVKYTYDQNSNVLEKIHYNLTHNSLEGSSFKYKGSLLVETNHLEGQSKKSNLRTIFSYNGKTLVKLVMDDLEDKTKYQEQFSNFDLNKNWLESNYFTNEKQNTIVKRIIEYY